MIKHNRTTNDLISCMRRSLLLAWMYTKQAVETRFVSRLSTHCISVDLFHSANAMRHCRKNSIECVLLVDFNNDLKLTSAELCF